MLTMDRMSGGGQGGQSWASAGPGDRPRAHGAVAHAHEGADGHLRWCVRLVSDLVGFCKD